MFEIKQKENRMTKTYNVRARDEEIHARYEAYLKEKGLGRSEHLMSYIRAYIGRQEAKK